MALVKFGGGIIGMAGSIAGNTFARNRSGSYVRARTKPTNPNTARQVAVRAYVSQLTTRWGETLTAVQRAAWDLYAASVNMLNRLGETIQLTGFNHFVRSNSAMLQMGETIVDDGPTLFSLPEADSIFAVTISEATQLVSVAFNPLLAWANETGGFMVVSVGSPQKATINYFNGPWRHAGQIEGDDITAPTSPATVAVPFVCTTGQKVFVRAKIVRLDGRVSNPFRNSIVVGA